MKRIKYDVQKETRVLWIIKELGLASIEEAEDRYQELFDEPIENANLIIRRWKARKAFVMENGRYKIANIPPWFKSLRMDQLIHLTKKESTEMLKDLEDFFTGGEVVGGKKPQWRDFVKLQLTFESLDPILGGRPGDVEGKTVFPREGEKLIVPINWMKGLTRDNAALMNVVGLQYHVAWGKGYWEDGIETIIKTAPISTRGKGIGVAHYESVPAGNKFTIFVRWPMRGCAINSIEKIQEWCAMMAETPIRGLGANSKAYGGRIKLVEISKID